MNIINFQVFFTQYLRAPFMGSVTHVIYIYGILILIMKVKILSV